MTNRSPKKREICVFEISSKKKPFEQWLKKLPFQTRIKIYRSLDRMALGNFGNCKSLKDGIFELKINWGPGYRIYFGLKDNEIVLLYAGDKSTQKKDIITAKRYWRFNNG